MGEDLAADLVRRAGMNGCSVRASPSLQPPRRLHAECAVSLPLPLSLTLSLTSHYYIMCVYIHIIIRIIVWSGKRA